MQFRDLPEPGSYLRFFVEMVAMFLLVTAFAFWLIAAAYAADEGMGRVDPGSPQPIPIAAAWR
jgi:hypothetical protein